MNFKENSNQFQSREYVSDDFNPNEFLSNSNSENKFINGNSNSKESKFINGISNSENKFVNRNSNSNENTSVNSVDNSNENKFIKGIIDKSLDNKKSLKFSKSVDVRIVLTDLSYIESISSTLNNFDLSNFNVVISSIIPTNDIEIAKNATHGADLLLVATEFSDEGKKLFYQLKKSLKTDFNYIEYLKLPNESDLDNKYHPYNNYEDKKDFTEFFEDEISNSIIRAGLSCVSNLFLINQSKLKFFQIKDDYDNVNQKLDKVTIENNHLNDESRSLRDKNQELTEEVLSLQNDLDKLKSDYESYKSRFENMYSKDFLELFNLNDLWFELFDERVYDDLYDSIILATNEFEPKDIIVGQGLIGAKNKEDALDWLKIIKTALIVNSNSFKDNSNKRDISEDRYKNENYSSRNFSDDKDDDYSPRDDYNIDESYSKTKNYEDDDDINDVSDMFSIF